MSEAPTVTLAGKTYPLAWGNLARVRFSGIPEETRALGGVVPLATMVWASIAQKPNPFPTWEHVADLLDTGNVADTEAALMAILPSVDAEKKST